MGAIVIMRSRIKVAGSAIVGRSHERSGIPCQDKIQKWRGLDRNSAGIALADGAGSSSHSQLGAEYCVKAIVPYIDDNFDLFFNNLAYIGSEVVSFLVRGLLKISKANEIDVRALACTLLFINIKKKGNNFYYIAGHIGDGVIVFSNEGNISVLSEPDRGEFANMTKFLTSNNSHESLRVYSGIINRPAGFLLMSDGAAETLYIRQTKQPNITFCQQILNWSFKYPQRTANKAIYNNLDSGIFREVSTDDCSICVLSIN